MKHTFLFLFLLVEFSSCKKLHELTQFNMDYETDMVFSTGLPINLPVNISTPDISTNSEQQFAINDTRKDLIESIKLTQLKLTITSPSGKTFSFLKDIRIYISAPNLPEVEVASRLNIDNSVGAELQPTAYDVELKEYIKADTFTLRAATTTDELLTSQVNVHLYAKFFVDAKILGL